LRAIRRFRVIVDTAAVKTREENENGHHHVNQDKQQRGSAVDPHKANENRKQEGDSHDARVSSHSCAVTVADNNCKVHRQTKEYKNTENPRQRRLVVLLAQGIAELRTIKGENTRVVYHAIGTVDVKNGSITVVFVVALDLVEKTRTWVPEHVWFIGHV